MAVGHPIRWFIRYSYNAHDLRVNVVCCYFGVDSCSCLLRDAPFWGRLSILDYDMSAFLTIYSCDSIIQSMSAIVNRLSKCGK